VALGQKASAVIGITRAVAINDDLGASKTSAHALIGKRLDVLGAGGLHIGRCFNGQLDTLFRPQQAMHLTSTIYGIEDKPSHGAW
jgi:hypothetical protein